MHHFTLDTLEVKSDHTATNTAEVLNEIAEIWKFKDIPAFFTTDEAKNMINCVEKEL